LRALTGDSGYEREEWEARQIELRAEWADIAEVRHCVEICEGDEKYLRVLRGVIERWAPQNADLIPPAPAVGSKRTLPPGLNALLSGMPDEEIARVQAMVDQHGASATLQAIGMRMGSVSLRPTPSYLTPEQLAEARRKIVRDARRAPDGE
jgi:hypothetical protein